MTKYPTLTAMGVTSIQDVTKYTLRQQGNTDVLKIYYKRAKGSFLSRSKKFSFARGRSSIPIESRSSEGFDKLSHTSPQLLEAIQELDNINAQHEVSDPQLPREKLDAHIDHLEKVVDDKLREMRELIKEL